MKFGVTQAFTCSYLSEKQEQLLVCMEEDSLLEQQYSTLIQVGFRRSGEQLYRPHCKKCNACESLRIMTASFQPSKSQKRILKRNTDIDIKIVEDERDDYYQLYERYISQKHADGSMYPPSYEQYRNFIHCNWQQPLYIEGRIDSQLVGVAVTDKVAGGLSALYSFFEPELSNRSLGTYFILQQIAVCQDRDVPYLYLGYQIDQCSKMNYKNKFYPHQRYQNDKWTLYKQR